MYEVIPGILEKKWSEIEKKLNSVKSFASTVHIDLIDGKFVNNTTFLDPEPFRKYSQDLFLELHMMVENPIDYVKPWGEAGFRRFLGHIEKMPDQEAFISEVGQYGEVGLAIDGPTPLDELHIPANKLDCLLVMTIKAGFSGQEFNQEYLQKVEALRKQTNIPIEVDGGIKDSTIIHAKQAGANRFIATSFIHNNPNPEAAYQTLVNLIK